MALTTRVWSAGKLLLLGGALLLTYVVFAAASMRVAIRTREVIVPTLTGQSVNQATAALAEAGLTLKVEEARRSDPKVPAGQILTQDPQPGVRTRRAAQRQGLGQRRAAVEHRAGCSSANRSARRSCACSRTGSSWPGSRKSGRRTTPPTSSSPRRRRHRAAGGRVSLLVNRGQRAATYVMPDLIGVNGDRAADLLRTRGFRAAVVGDHPYPGVPAGIVLRQNPQAGFQIAPGRAHLARSQPLMTDARPDCAVHLCRRLRGPAGAARGAGGGRRRPDSRRRHGRPLRAEPHDGTGRSWRRSGASTRLPLDVHLMISGPRPLPPGVLRRRGLASCGARRGPFPTCTARFSAIKKLGAAGGRGDQPGDAGRGARGDRARISTTCW